MSDKVTKELVLANLQEWTPSTQVQEKLGLSSMEDAVFKRQFYALEEKGIVEREGAKRGLKFRAVTQGKTEAKPVEKAKPTAEDAPKAKAKRENSLDISEIPCEITIIHKHEYMSDVTNVGIGSLIAFMLKAHSEQGNRTLSIKKSPKGITVKTYNDIYLLSEVTYTKENFYKLLKASGITLD